MGKTILESWLEAAQSAEGLGVKNPWGDGWISRDAPTYYEVTIPGNVYEPEKIERIQKSRLETLNRHRSLFRSRLHFRSRPGLALQMQLKHPIKTRAEIIQETTQSRIKQAQAKGATEKIRRQVLKSLEEGRGD